MGIREKLAKWKRKQEIKSGQQREIKKAEGAAYQKAKLKEAAVFGAQRAKFEREQKYKQLRTRGGMGRGIIGGMAEKVNIAAENLGYAPQRAMKSVAKGKRQKKRSRIIKYKGKKYQLVKSKKRKKRRRSAPQRERYQQERLNPFSTSL